jgi:hypothetical protein
MSKATVSITEERCSVVVTENGKATTIVTPPTAVTVVISTAGPSASPVAGVTDIAETAQVISSDYILAAGKNGVSVGSVEVAEGYTVTVPAGAVWLIAD